MRWSRRTFLKQAGCGAAVLGAGNSLLQVPSEKTRLILLGTAGGPTPKKSRAAPAQVIVVNNNAYVVDCGNGVGRQLALAGIPFTSIRHLFLTHHHSDHNADYGTLLLLAWGSGLRTRVDTWGPPPLTRMTRLFWEMSLPDLKVREADEGRPPLPPLVHPHELTEDGPVMQDENIKVRCAMVSHPPVERSFAYRFDASDRSIVISGDTTRSESLIALSKNADILIHEALYLPALEKIAGSDPGAARLKNHLIESHTPVEEVGRIAAQAGVKTLVLSHLVPAEVPAVPDDAWLAGAGVHFKGRIVVGRDLMEI